MKKRVFLITILLACISLLIFNINVEAANTTLICNIKAEKTEIKQGEETVLTLEIENSSDNINAFQAKINYDSNVWEELDEDNFETINEWESLKYNSNNKEFNIINKQENTNKEILKIKLKAKDNAVAGNTEIAIDEIVASNGTSEFESAKLNQNIDIKSNENITDKDNQTPSNTENTNNNNKNEPNIIEKLKEKLPSILPKTGTGRFLLFMLVAAIILSIILYCRNKKCGKKMLMIIVCIILINQSSVYTASGVFVGDINQSSVIDDEDIKIMQEYLIKLKNVTSQEQADMNNDGKLSIIDLSLLIKQQKECPYDKNNVTNISSWASVPMVSKELLQKTGVTTGGEGCQWPIGMAISKDGKLLLYGTDVGGVYRSEDGGKNWEQSNAGLESRGVGAFAIDQKNSSHVLAVGINSGAFNTNGLYISEDGGKTWKVTKNMLIKGHRDIREAITFDESSYNQEKNKCMIAYWSTAYETEDNGLKESEKGLYKTIDGGYTWKLINSDLCDGIVKVNQYTGDVYVSRKDGIYYSNNKGESFEKIVNESVSGLDLVSKNNQTVSVYYCNKDGIYISKDEKSFEKVESSSYPKTQPMNIKVSPVNPEKILIVDKEGSYKNYPYYSLDGGKTWKGSTFSNELSFMPYNNRASIPMWSTTDENKVWIFAQGDYMSSSIDSGKTFKWDSNGITGILSGGNVHYNVYNPDIIYFGSQDYDGCVTTDGGKTWKYISMSGLSWGGYCYGGYAVDENTYFVGVSTAWTDPRKLKITFDGGKTVIDTGMCFTSQNIRSGMESSYQSPTDPKVLFACDLRSSDGGHTWAKMNGCINVYTHNPKGKKELYGIDEKGKNIVVSYDNGVTWQKVNNTEIKPQSQIGSIYILDLSYDWKNEMVYVACDGGYLYRISTKDGSIECVLDKNVAEYKRAPVNLKGGYSITKVAVDPIDPNIIYCGGPGNTFLNDCALYRSVDGGKSFQVITSNTKNSIIKQGKQGGFETNSLEVNPKTGELLFAGGCFGISKLSPPYKLNN